MLIRKIQLKFEKSNLQKKKSWVTKFGDLTTFLPINRSFQHIHKGGQFCTSGENTKTLTLKTHLFQTSRSPPLSQKQKVTAPLALIFLSQAQHLFSSSPHTLGHHTFSFPSRPQYNPSPDLPSHGQHRQRPASTPPFFGQLTSSLPFPTHDWNCQPHSRPHLQTSQGSPSLFSFTITGQFNKTRIRPSSNSPNTATRAFQLVANRSSLFYQPQIQLHFQPKSPTELDPPSFGLR